ncbi:hypothetical protein ADL19_16060 [Streptomyces purpurogeneiscleroticus]|nr:hypothetical protein ADL19_16060 [Streptomyces purpurogeneiscleroticus]
MTLALTPVDPDSRRFRPRDAGSSDGRVRIRQPPPTPGRLAQHPDPPAILRRRGRRDQSLTGPNDALPACWSGTKVV